MITHIKTHKKTILLLNDFAMKFDLFRLLRHFWSEKCKVKKKKKIKKIKKKSHLSRELIE